jgi:hypothetical protein
MDSYLVFIYSGFGLSARHLLDSQNGSFFLVNFILTYNFFPVKIVKNFYGGNHEKVFEKRFEKVKQIMSGCLDM